MFQVDQGPPEDFDCQNQRAIERYLADMRAQQNLGRAVGAGLVVGILCALLWAGIAYVTGYTIGWVAIGVGFAVGSVVRFQGRGMEPKFGILAAGLSLMAVALGKLWALFAILGSMTGVGFFTIVTRVNVFDSVQILVETFEAMDLLFFGLAVWQGYMSGWLRPEQVSIPSHLLRTGDAMDLRDDPRDLREDPMDLREPVAGGPGMPRPGFGEEPASPFGEPRRSVGTGVVDPQNLTRLGDESRDEEREGPGRPF